MERADAALLWAIPCASVALLVVAAWQLFAVAPSGECVKREAWHLDGGSVIQAHGTRCVEWR